MLLGCVMVGMVASVAAAVCGALCLWRLRPRKEPEPVALEATEDEGDAALREGILNLMRYAPTEKQEGEE